MPQQRQRIVFCDCLDCVQQPATTDIASTTSAANEAAAKQEPPPKCLMFVLSGVLLAQSEPQQQQQQQQQQQRSSSAATLLDRCNLPHLNRATALGNLCWLTVRDSSAADCCAELARLFNVHEEFQQGQPPGSLADKFKGMQASFASNSSSATQLAAACGLSASNALDIDESDEATAAAAAAAEGAAAEGLPAVLAGGSGVRQRHGRTTAAAAAAAAGAGPQLPDPAEAARRMLLELGLQQADAGLDMVIVHLDASSSTTSSPQQQQGSQGQLKVEGSHSAAAAVGLLAWVDRTLRYLNNSSAFKDTVLLTVLASPGAAGPLPAPVPLLQAGGGCPVSEVAKTTAQQQANKQQQQHTTEAGSAEQPPAAAVQPAGRPVLRPLQSWQQLGGAEIAVDLRRPLLCMRRLPGVIRRDGCSRFSLAECCSSSGVLGLLADRLMPEIAYKLGRAPKYGA